jgi:hypothetical protein
MISEGVVFWFRCWDHFEEVLVFILAFAQASESRLASFDCMLGGNERNWVFSKMRLECR